MICLLVFTASVKWRAELRAKIGNRCLITYNSILLLLCLRRLLVFGLQLGAYCWLEVQVLYEWPLLSLIQFKVLMNDVAGLDLQKRPIYWYARWFFLLVFTASVKWRAELPAKIGNRCLITYNSILLLLCLRRLLVFGLQVGAYLWIFKDMSFSFNDCSGKWEDGHPLTS